MNCTICNRKLKTHSFAAITACLMEKGISISIFLLDVSDNGIFKYDKDRMLEVLKK